MNTLTKKEIPLLIGLLLSISIVNAENITKPIAGEPDGVETRDINQKGLGFAGGKSVIYVTRTLASSNSIYSDDIYSYNGGGCIQNTDAAAIYFDTNLAIPGGSRIVSVTMLYENLGGGNLEYVLFNTEGGGEYNIVSNKTIPATTGYNNVGEFVWLDVTPSQSYLMRANINDSNGIPCLFRVGYIPADIASDVIFLNNFFR